MSSLNLLNIFIAGVQFRVSEGLDYLDNLPLDKVLASLTNRCIQQLIVVEAITLVFKVVKSVVGKGLKSLLYAATFGLHGLVR